MSLVIEPQHVPLSTDTDGVLRLSGTRVTLDTVIDAFQDGASAEEIALRYPAISLPDIYAAITYYLKNRAAVESYLSERRESASAVRHANEQRFELGDLRERLLQRRRDTSV